MKHHSPSALPMERLLLSCCLYAMVSLAWADLPVPVASALREAGIPQEAVGLYVRRVDQTRPLLENQADVPMNPASAMKLLTTYAGLELLGPAHVWKTEIYATGSIEAGVLAGDLVLKGYGDPALTLPAFWDMLRGLRQSGLREIRGDLVLDRSHFDIPAQDPGAFDGEPWRAYNALPDALLVNFKAIRFRLRGDAAQGRVNVEADPELPVLEVINQIELRHGPCADWKDRITHRVDHAGGRVVVALGGHYSAACGEKSLELAVLDDAVYVEQLFRWLWAEQGGMLHGVSRQGILPAGAVLLARAHSPPLAEIVRMINKYSNNVMARQLLLTLGAERKGAPGNTEKGIAVLREWLMDKKLDFPELVLENGAGLSRQERISARHLGEMLISAWQSPVMPELMASLPVAAMDGTLERRLLGSPVAGRAHLKTGSLDGVRAVAGYLLDRQGQRWVVVFVVNHTRAGESRQAQDALLEWLYSGE